MDPEVHGNRVYNWDDWRTSSTLTAIIPQFRNYDDIVTNRCWAHALERLFGEPIGEEIVFLPNYGDTNPNRKYYYHKVSCQIWRLAKVPGT